MSAWTSSAFVSAREIYELQLERVGLLVGAHYLSLASDDEARLADITRILSACEGDLSSPMETLAYLYGLSKPEKDFLWAAVAFTADVRIPPLTGGSAEGGLSLRVYGELGELGRHQVAAIGFRLGVSDPLIRHQLVESDDNAGSPLNVLYWARSKVVEYLSGAHFAGSGLFDPPPRYTESGRRTSRPHAPPGMKG